LIDALKIALELDQKDSLALVKDKFELPPNTVYLDGNSLGPMLKSIKAAVIDVVQEQWGNGLITSWNQHHWIDLPTTVGEKIANLLGAAPGQVVCTDSVSVNLFKLLGCALKLNPERSIVLTETSNFPTDVYIADGFKTFLPEQKCQLQLSDSAELLNSLNADIAVLLLTQVDFRSGKLHDIAKITAAAQHFGIIVIWDLAHSAGAVPLQLDAWNVDFAVGCGYKYLNGGPGAPAFIYAAKRHHSNIQQPLRGWMGHKAPFDFDLDYSPSPDVRQFLCGTPPIVSMHVLNTALDVFQGIKVEEIRAKAMALSSFFEDLIAQSELLREMQLISPNDPKQRGNQLAYRHPNAYAICQALIAENVIADFRSPDLLRFGFSALFLSFTDIAKAAQTLHRLFETKSYLEPRFSKRQRVT
jgi:kynureninase